MHIIFEGVLPRDIKALMHYCICEKHYFTLQVLNKQISNLAYGYSEKVNKPRPLDRDHLTAADKKIVQSGKYMSLT